MTCCDCNETPEQRYARWDREKVQSKAAALANPDTWISVSDVAEDAGDIGGDVQAGAAWSKRFVRWMPSVGKWAVINDAYYMRFSDDIEDENSNESKIDGVERQLEFMIVRDPNEAGDTEEWSDYEYETYYDDPDSPILADHSREQALDTYARELAAGTCAVDYPDPLQRRDAAVWAL